MSEATRPMSVSVAKPGVIFHSIPVRLAVTLGFVGLIALGAHARFALPFTPVPITLQTLFVLVAGAILGPLDAAFAVAIYLGLGSFGAPLFAKANSATGLSYFSGVTGGYLIGFFAAAIFVGFAIRKSEKLALQALAIFAGSLIILSFGTLWLKFVSGRTLWESFVLGFAPFLIGDVVKVSVSLAAYRACIASQRRTKDV